MSQNEVSMRYGVNGRTVHLSRGVVIGGVPVSFCNTEVRHFYGGGTYTVAGRRAYGSRTVKLCKRCIHPNMAAIADGIIAFVLWAASHDAPAAKPPVHKAEWTNRMYAPCGARIARVLGEDFEIFPSTTGEEGQRPVTCLACLKALAARPCFKAPLVTVANDVLRKAIPAKARADVARAGMVSADEHGIVGLRYGCYRHANDRSYVWGNFTGEPEDVACAVVPSVDNTASDEALASALLASIGG